MQSLPASLYGAEEVRELDRIAIEERGIDGAALMERAGLAAFAALRRRWPGARRIAVLCGSGNNGGDGYVVARAARESGLGVTVMAEKPPRAGAAAQARARLERSGVTVAAFDPDRLGSHDVVVDGLLGTGLSDEVRGTMRGLIEAMNACGRPLLALDIPSGLNADTGRRLGSAVRADLTVTFIGLKLGLFTGEGPAHAGRVVFDDLEVPPGIYDGVALRARRIMPPRLPRRRADAHKGLFGHVLVIGGDHGMAGAARMAGEAAARTGAGLVSVATRASHAGLVSAARPELMARGVEDTAGLRSMLARADVIAVGPGLGTGEWSRGMLGAALDARLPMVVDADALNLLAGEPARRDDWVLTPHPGEAARLLGTGTREVQQDRPAAVRALQQRFGGTCVLKGAGTLLCDGDGPLALCDRGNPGMASGGMGDVLTGLVAGLVAQRHALGVDIAAAARLGVWLHAAAGDRAARDGEAGMLATDLLPHARRLLNECLVG